MTARIWWATAVFVSTAVLLVLAATDVWGIRGWILVIYGYNLGWSGERLVRALGDS